MPIYDRKCDRCGRVRLDTLEPIGEPEYLCGVGCPGLMRRVWLPGQKANGVIPDDIPGGVEIKHGLCNPDGTPRRYDSKSEMTAEAKRRGLTNLVEHKGSKGSDKSSQTSRWI